MRMIGSVAKIALLIGLCGTAVPLSKAAVLLAGWLAGSGFGGFLFGLRFFLLVVWGVVAF